MKKNLLMKIFISYSHKDEKWKNKLEEHLRVFELEGILETWSDRKIETGEDWFLKIEEALNISNIAILLISKDFLTSNFILKKEVPAILKRRETGDLIIFPIIIRPCNWQETAWLKKIKVQPKDGKPLSSFDNEKDEIESQLAELASQIYNIFLISSKQHSKIKNEESKHFDSAKSSFLDFLYTYKNILFIISSIIMLVLVFSFNNKEISIYFYKYLNSKNYKYKLGETYKESITGIEFVWITGGFFEMGCNDSEILCEEYEKPIHKVFIDGFWIGKYEITQEQWQIVMKDNPSANQNGKDNPVERVSWNDTQEFINNLIKLNKNNKKFRLPTEAEWEYACRKSVNEELNKNIFGLYNMIHSVNEWCKDVYFSGAYSKHKRLNPCYENEKEGSGRVVRGRLKCTLRQSSPENSKGKSIGFRIVFNP